MSNRAVVVHYTALWVLNCDPSTGRDMWSSMTLLWKSARDVIHIHPLSSTHTQLYLQSQEASGSATQLAVAGTALPMQRWKLKIPGVAWLWDL